MKPIRLLSTVLLLLPALTFLHACGGSSSDSGGSPSTTTTITGSVFAAPVNGAIVTVKNASGSTIAGPISTASDGSYSIAIPNGSLASDLIISSTSGTFVDEATATPTAAGSLSAYIAGGTLTAGSAVHIDPSSTIVADLVKNHGKTLFDAKTAFASAFGYTPDASVAPQNNATATASERLAALRAMTFSQLTHDLGLGGDKQFDLLTAIAQDLADGVLDSKDAGGVVSLGTGTMPEDIENRFEHSLVSLLTNTTTNLTGLTPDKIGSLPFAKVALTNSYRVEYMQMGMMGATQGKTIFKLKITDPSGTTPVTGLVTSSSLKLMPMMHMSAMQHSTPVDSIVDNNDGTYTCSVYYLMASGMNMGYWELKVMIGSGMSGETATFYPAVAMAMGSTTVRATLKGQNDIISSMTGTEKRSYYLFNEGLTGTTGFNLFIAAKESMMSYPAVSGGTTLHDETGAAWTVNPITVSASTDGSTWTAATDNTGGHWSVSGLSGLSSGVTGTIYVKLNINDEDKTTNGNTASGSNAYASFTVTP